MWDGTAAELEAQAPASAYRLFTSDDAQALELAADTTLCVPSAGVAAASCVAARPDALDELVVALGDARVLIRRLELVVSPLESMFFALTQRTTPQPDALEPEQLADTILAGA